MTIPVLSHPQVVLADPDFFRSTSHLVGDFVFNSLTILFCFIYLTSFF